MSSIPDNNFMSPYGQNPFSQADDSQIVNFMLHIDPIRTSYDSMEQNISILIQHDDEEEEEEEPAIFTRFI